MKAGSRWTPGEIIGVFLEVHAPDDARPAAVSVELERKRSWLARLGGLLGLGGRTPVKLEWTQRAAGGRFPLSFNLDARDASEGEYTLCVSVEAQRLSPVTVERELRIVEE